MVNRSAFHGNRRGPVSGLSDREWERRYDPEAVEHRELVEKVDRLCALVSALLARLETTK